jgi:competence protein ComEC
VVAAEARPERRAQAAVQRRRLRRAEASSVRRIAWLLACVVTTLATARAATPLRIYFADVEGGQATLVVSPSGESLLVDTGWPGFNGRDADRIAAMAKKAGVKAFDYLVITHYHDDHVGGLAQLGARVKFKTLITHGPNIEHNSTATAMAEVYRTAIDAVRPRELVVKPGDVIPIKGLDVKVVAAARQLISEPLPGGGQPNPRCDGVVQKRADGSENSMSVGMLMHALQPRVAIMNNGARKGGDAPAIQIVRRSPGLQDLWMLHAAVAAGAEVNVPAEFIANVEDSTDPAVNDKGFGISVSADADGSFTVTNERTRKSKNYKPVR